jgi:hypothetical protein
LRLGEAMVKDGQISSETLAKALERQIIFGGRLGTNLVEMGAVTEEALAKFLGKVLGVPYAGPDKFKDIPQDAIDAFPTELAKKYTAFPIFRERARLHLAMKDPNDITVIDELRFIVGLDIKTYIASEIRIMYALEKFYGIKRNLRYISILDEEDKKPAPGGVQMFTKTAPPPPPVKEPEPEPQPQTPEPPEPPEPDDEPEIDYTAQPVKFEWPEPEVISQPDMSQPSAPQPQALQQPVQPSVQPTPVQAAPVQPAAPEDPYAVLANPPDREAIAGAVVAAAAVEVSRAVLFLARGNAVAGWRAAGTGLSDDMAAGMSLPIGEQCIFKSVIEEKATYKGPVLRVPDNAALLEHLGGKGPQEAAAIPLVIRGKVVGVLYADDGEGSIIRAGGFDRLTALMAKASMSLEILILKTKILSEA